MTTPPTRDVKHVSLLWAGQEMAPEIARLHADLFPEPWDTESVGRLLEHPGATALIARTGFPKVSVGFVMGQIAGDQAEILSIGVVPDWQRVGLATRLVDGVERALMRAKVQRLFLEVAMDNAAARALYAGRGFQENGRRKGYYVRGNGTSVDAIVMCKEIAPSQ